MRIITNIASGIFVLSISRWGILCAFFIIAACILFGCRASIIADTPSNRSEVKGSVATPENLTQEEQTILPSFVNECFDRNSWLISEIDITSTPKYNPYFMRGDLDGDGSVDYVVVVQRRAEKNSEGLLVCLRDNKTRAILIGLDHDRSPPFWRLTDWDIETEAEVTKITDFRGRSIGIRPKGESIIMKWEDAIGVVYWDGKEFQWKQVILNKES